MSAARQGVGAWEVFILATEEMSVDPSKEGIWGAVRGMQS